MSSFTSMCTELDEKDKEIAELKKVISEQSKEIAEQAEVIDSLCADLDKVFVQ